MTTPASTPVVPPALVPGPFSPRAPWGALALSFLAAGVGHVYCGRIAKGLALYCVWFLIPVLCLTAVFLPSSSVVLVLCILAPAAAVVALYLYAAADAFRIARRTPPEYRVKDYNSAGLYALMILIGLVYPIVMMAGLKAFVLEAYMIPTRSMSPSIVDGDRVLVNKLAFAERSPERGDVVVFRNPGPGAPVFVKRVVGVAGDRITIDQRELRVNDAPLPRTPISTEGGVYYESNGARHYRVMYSRETPSPPGVIETTVPDRSVFLLGDNRDGSQDSRHFGSVHIGDVLGVVQYVYLPGDTWKRFGAFRE